MITALKTVGQTHNIQVIATYEGDNATVTVILSPKESKTPPTIIPPLYVSGPVAEVEAYLTENIGKEVASTAELTSSIGELEKKKEAAEKELADAERKATQAKQIAENAKEAAAKKAKPAKPEVKEPAKATVKLSEVKPAYKKAEAEAPVPAPADDDDLMAELAALGGEEAGS
jgi:phage shock protein A